MNCDHAELCFSQAGAAIACQTCGTIWRSDDAVVDPGLDGGRRIATSGSAEDHGPAFAVAAQSRQLRAGDAVPDTGLVARTARLSFYFRGECIWDRQLSDDQIRQHMQALGRGGKPRGC